MRQTYHVSFKLSQGGIGGRQVRVGAQTGDLAVQVDGMVPQNVDGIVQAFTNVAARVLEHK